ncbi:hypothetical protein CPC08DRAFT_730296 [Agrocybe pediades]|nr:hypothetical protein CPC08DRAFT_730296 [Agrocybe pediades]
MGLGHHATVRQWVDLLSSTGGMDIDLAGPDTSPSANQTLDTGRPVRATLQPNFSSSSSVTTTVEKNHEELWKNLTRFYDDNEEVINNIRRDRQCRLGGTSRVRKCASYTRSQAANAEHDMHYVPIAKSPARPWHVKEGEREQEKERLQRPIKVIADDITKCGSDLNYYMDRKFVLDVAKPLATTKLFNAKTYKRRFADHIETFVRHRSELQNTITAYIAAGTDSANIAISDVARKVDNMDAKLDVFIQPLFRKLDKPIEGELQSFIQHYGVTKCLSKDELLTQLLTRAGESLDNNKRGLGKRELLIEIRKELNKELGQNLDEVFSQNLSRFERLLNMQSNNMERISAQLQYQRFQHDDNSMKLDKLVSTSILILEEGKLIKKADIPNSKVKLKDPEFQQIWDRMVIYFFKKTDNMFIDLENEFRGEDGV